MKTAPAFVIRCATPHCEWGFPMPDMGEEAFDACYSASRKHWTEVHGLTPNTAAHSLVHVP